MLLVGLCLTHSILDISATAVLGFLGLALAVFGAAAYAAQMVVRREFPLVGALWALALGLCGLCLQAGGLPAVHFSLE